MTQLPIKKEREEEKKKRKMIFIFLRSNSQAELVEMESLTCFIDLVKN